MENNDIMCELIPILDGRGPATPLRPSESTAIGKFLGDFRRIGRQAGFVEPLAEFKPFWESMLKTAQAALQTEVVVEGRWTLRSRRARPVSAEETRTRVRLQCAKSLKLATAVRDAYGELLEDGSSEARLVHVAMEFCTKMMGSPSALTGADRSEIKALETAAEGFIQPTGKDAYEQQH